MPRAPQSLVLGSLQVPVFCGQHGSVCFPGCLSKVPNLGWLPPTEMYGLSLETGSPKSRCLQCLVPSGSSRGGSFLISSSSWCFQQPLAAFSPGTWLSSPCVSTSSPLCLCLSLFTFPLFIRTPSGLGEAHPNDLVVIDYISNDSHILKSWG